MALVCLSPAPLTPPWLGGLWGGNQLEKDVTFETEKAVASSEDVPLSLK